MINKEEGLLIYNVFLLGFIMAFSIYLLVSYKNVNQSCSIARKRGHTDMIAGYSAAVSMALLLIFIIAANCS
jgi:hypothetical protein